ncbi:hypothetical protein GF371_03925 [Candidatus Woesearchaeota archaeon]|nr:hypothetical protein [Candidatus Woesearchaeota archaeon]
MVETTMTHRAVEHARRILGTSVFFNKERDNLEDLVWLRKNITGYKDNWSLFKKDLEDRFHKRGEYKQTVFKWDTRNRICADIARVDYIMRLERAYNITFDIRREDEMNPYSGLEVYAVEKGKR